jgi:glycosyltransferase involved in cell wall biosynthesis
MSKVSICSSVYNQSELLKGMIASVIGQSFKDWELIVVDDGSTEDIKKVCTDWNDPRIVYERFPENRGSIEGMNHAITLATGEYIGFLSADERIDLNKLMWQVGYLDDHPNIGGVWGLPHNGPLGERPEWEQYELKAHNRSNLAWIKTLLNLEQIPIGGASWLTRKSVIDDIGGFDKSTGKCSDLELFVRFFKKYEGRVMPYRWAWEDEANKATKPLPSVEDFQKDWNYVRAKHSLDIPAATGRVTVAVPVHNMQTMIPHTLLSLREQTVKDVDVVVFDDASTDNTIQTIETIAANTGQNISIIRSTDNVGPNAAQNHMLAQCKTPFFVVLAADDLLEPTFLERCLAEFARDPWLEYVGTQTDFIDLQGKPHEGEHGFKSIMKASNKPRDTWLQQLYYGNQYFGCGMYRTKAAQDLGGWDTTVGVLGDYDMYLKLLQRENIHVIEESLTHTRIHDNNRSILKTREEQQELREHYHKIRLRYWQPRMKVIIATPFYEMRGFSPYIVSMTHTIQLLTRMGIEHEFWELSGDSYVDRAKNTILNKFLEDPGATDIFMIDSDMQWDPMSIVKMLQIPEEIVMGSYPQKNMWETWTSLPVVVAGENGHNHPVGRQLEDGTALLQAAFIAGGFMRIKRSALETYKEKYADYVYHDSGADPHHPTRTYTEFFTCERAKMTDDGPMLRWGEDRVFGKRMKEIGIDGWIYPNIDFGHYGIKGWMGNYDRFLRKNVTDAEAKAKAA